MAVMQSLESAVRFNSDIHDILLRTRRLQTTDLVRNGTGVQDG